ncbi:MAG: DNA-3-methyladenine glycosylase I [Desulfobacterales bacterium]
MTEKIKRCPWAGTDPIYVVYHDSEWGVPLYDDRKLFEFLVLEGAQAGLSWITVLKKRDAYRQAFDHFDPKKIANYDENKIQELLLNKGIIRNRLKIASAIQNAEVFLKVKKESGSFAAFIWQFVDGKPIKNARQTIDQIPAQTKISIRMSKELKKKGFGFVGPTICYAFMQAVGMVNDHTLDCFRYNML